MPLQLECKSWKLWWEGNSGWMLRSAITCAKMAQWGNHIKPEDMERYILISYYISENIFKHCGNMAKAHHSHLVGDKFESVHDVLPLRKTLTCISWGSTLMEEPLNWPLCLPFPLGDQSYKSTVYQNYLLNEKSSCIVGQIRLNMYLNMLSANNVQVTEVYFLTEINYCTLQEYFSHIKA